MKNATRMGFEPTRAEHNGLAVHRLNHSATLSPSDVLLQKRVTEHPTFTFNILSCVTLRFPQETICQTFTPKPSVPLLPSTTLVILPVGPN